MLPTANSTQLLALAFCSAALAFALQPSSASAEARKPNIMYPVDSSMVDIVEPGQHTSNIIFLNKCVGGCTIFPGNDDSRTNTSSVVAGTLGQTAFISEFAYGQAEWDEIVDCVTRVYEPYGIVITDQDPGSNVSHFIVSWRCGLWAFAGRLKCRADGSTRRLRQTSRLTKQSTNKPSALHSPTW